MPDGIYYELASSYGSGKPLFFLCSGIVRLDLEKQLIMNDKELLEYYECFKDCLIPLTLWDDERRHLTLEELFKLIKLKIR